MSTLETTTLPAHFLKRSQRITVYPNLVSQHQFWLQLYNIEKCVFTVQLYSLAGNELFRHFYYHDHMHSTHCIKLPLQLTRGIYRLAIQCDEILYKQPLIVQ